MIDRKEFAQELILREQIRRAIRIIQQKRETKLGETLTEEVKLRSLIRSLLTEKNAVAVAAKHANTGINVLEDLLKNSNILFVLEQGYKSLTTTLEQRQSYRNHIEVIIQKALAPEEERKIAGRLKEDVTIDIDNPEDDPDFIDVEEDTRSDDEKDLEDITLPGADLTGRNKAFRDFKDIEKSILEAFDDLDNPEDSGLFEEYLIKNLALYFDKYETELQADVAEPAAALAATAGAEVQDAELGLDTGEEEGAAIELQELIKYLNLDDIVHNLL